MIAPEGKIILIPLLAIIIVGFVINYLHPSGGLRYVNGAAVILFLFSLYFFRDPQRTFGGKPEDFISPGDGKIVNIEKIADPELGGEALQISIFLSVFNVHCQRVPLDGIVQGYTYTKGKFFGAYRHKASLENEQTQIIFQTEGKQLYKVKQIAGFIARRIICYMRPGMEVRRGDRLGFIRFGSRVDIIVPSSFQVEVSIGEHVRGGETVIGKFL
ncbi:MAG: phosphatidylserine decarboxylase family protein [FCB group bacterium]|nr:phosphatidylserine decarboxylase family protein [FCB group bacterium]